jgi:hypothetical protein
VASGAVIVAFERHFIFNQDLPERLRRDLPLTYHDRSTWRGHIDYSTRADMMRRRSRSDRSCAAQRTAHQHRSRIMPRLKATTKRPLVVLLDEYALARLLRPISSDG